MRGWTRHARLTLGILGALAGANAGAQWDLQNSLTKEDLRGISSPGNGVAWASGTHGTVLRTEDGGYMWQTCAMPPSAEQLDFRGIVGFDSNTAVVMSSGKGDLSRIYKTVDGCSSWKLVYTNPDKDGFWDAVSAGDNKSWMVLGDPVEGTFIVFTTSDAGATWTREKAGPAMAKEGAFAASNSALSADWPDDYAFFGTGSASGARLFARCDSCKSANMTCTARPMPMFSAAASAGIFSIAYSDWAHWVAVGGDYRKPELAHGNAAWSVDGGKHWAAPHIPPHGFRSAVAYDDVSKAWVTVGPNGTDISRDDGRTWKALRPGPGEPRGADRDWNALSLPYVVGPKGRIGKLRQLPKTAY